MHIIIWCAKYSSAQCLQVLYSVVANARKRAISSPHNVAKLTRLDKCPRTILLQNQSAVLPVDDAILPERERDGERECEFIFTVRIFSAFLPFHIASPFARRARQLRRASRRISSHPFLCVCVQIVCTYSCVVCRVYSYIHLYKLKRTVYTNR